MSIQRLLASTSAWLLATSIVSNGSLFLFQTILARSLGPASFGIFLIVWTMRMIALALGLLGLNLTAVRELAGRTEGQQTDTISSLLGLNILGAIATTLLLVAAARPLAQAFLGGSERAPLLYILAPAVCFGVLSKLIVGIELARNNMRVVLGGQIAEPLCLLAALAILLLRGSLLGSRTIEPESAVLAVAASAFLQCVLVIAAARRDGPMRNLDMRTVVKQLTPGFGLLGQGLAMSLLGLGYVFVNSIDRLLLGHLATAEVTARYVVAALLVAPAALFHAAISEAALAPLAASVGRNRREAQAGYQFVTSVTGTVALLYCSTLVAFGGSVLRWLFGEAFVDGDSAWILTALAAMRFLSAWTGPSSSMLLMGKFIRAELLSIAVLISSNLSLGLVLVPQFGGIGAAVAALVSAFLIAVLHMIMIRRFLGFWCVDCGQWVHFVLFAGLVLSASTFPPLVVWVFGLIVAATAFTASRQILPVLLGSEGSRSGLAASRSPAGFEQTTRGHAGRDSQGEPP